MKRLLQILALLILLLAAIFWAATGAHRGWTRTSVPIRSVDEVTGLEAITYQRRFVPGLDFLGVALLGATALAGASLMLRKQPKQKHQNQTQQTQIP